MVPTGKTGILKMAKIPKKCTKACRNYTPRQFTDAKPYSPEQIMERELDLLGVYLTCTPFDRIDPSALAECKTGSDLEVAESGAYFVAATIKSIRPHRDKHGNPMGFVTLHTPSGDVDTVVFKDAWSELRSKMKLNALCFAAVVKNRRGCQMTELEVV
jgi:DNA polymerase-3 subunit alpha